MITNPVGLEDRLAIHDLLSRYCHAMDAARADLCIGLFTEDATLDTPVGSAQGRTAIRAWIEQRLAQRSSDYQVGHYLLNPLLAALGPDQVRVRSMLLYTRQTVGSNTSAALVGTGIYEDEVRRTADGWRFQSRCYTLSAPLDEPYFQ